MRIGNFATVMLIISLKYIDNNTKTMLHETTYIYLTNTYKIGAI